MVNCLLLMLKYGRRAVKINTKVLLCIKGFRSMSVLTIEQLSRSKYYNSNLVSVLRPMVIIYNTGPGSAESPVSLHAMCLL